MGGSPLNFAMFQSFWKESDKYNHAQIGGRGSESDLEIWIWPPFCNQKRMSRFLSLQKMKFMFFEVFKLVKNEIHVFWVFLSLQKMKFMLFEVF